MMAWQKHLVLHISSLGGAVCDSMLQASLRLIVEGWGEFDQLGVVECDKGEGDCIPGLCVPLLVIGKQLWRWVRRDGRFMSVKSLAT